MEEERMLENERLQIEHIRELEMEELEIEEVDFDHYPSDDDDFNDRGDDGEAGQSRDFTFDTCLPSMHMYLGEVDDTHHRVAFLEGGTTLSLPMIYLEGAVLFPEATLPLRVLQPSFRAAVERALTQVEAPYTIGVIRVHRNPDDLSMGFATVGTTAEIRQYKRLEDGSVNLLTRGQQRFRLKRRWVDVEGAPCAEVQIIEEHLPQRTPRDAFGQLASISNSWKRSLSYTVPSDASCSRHNRYNLENDSDSMSETSYENDHSPTELRLHQSVLDSNTGYDRTVELINSDDELVCDSGYQYKMSYGNESGGSSQYNVHKNHSESEGSGLATLKSVAKNPPSRKDGWKEFAAAGPNSRATRSFWPDWVYRMYDSYCLAYRAADLWKQIIGAPSMDDLLKKPDLLSFYIACKIPVSESTRQELLEIDGISYRLRREIELLERFDRVRCRTCQTVFAKRSDMLVMSSDGPLGAYVNPGGHVHEIMTLDKANGVALVGRPVKEHSWFPGYAWTIAYCATCETQLGWLFTATKKMLKPKSFWGIRSNQVADDVQ